MIICAENDPDTNSSLAQLSNILRLSGVNYEKQIIKDANHSFYSIKWKTQVYTVIFRWINEQLMKPV